MASGKRPSVDEPLTEHDVAERLDKACLRVWNILISVEQMGPEMVKAVRASRYLSNVPVETRDALVRFLEPGRG